MRVSVIARSLARVSIGAAVAVAALATPASSASQFKVLYGFCAQDNCADGSAPVAPLTADSGGVLYGTTENGGGTVFALVPKDGKYQHIVIHNFGGDGLQPTAKLILDSAGNLYGTTSRGGNSDGGIVFELVRTQSMKSWDYKILYSFCSQGGSDCTDGMAAESGLTYAGASIGAPYDGTSPLYGVTSAGGANGGGVVYRLTQSGGTWSEDVLHNFCHQCTDGGSVPVGGLVIDATGKLYGATIVGGANYRGAVFELSRKNGAWAETVLYSFCSVSRCADGANPSAALLIDANGALYGTTKLGGNASGDCPLGSDGCGTLFKLVPKHKSSKETVLHAFCSEANCRDGMLPETAALAMDASGALYGTTQYGGTGSNVDIQDSAGGVLFQYGADSQYQVLYSFCSKTRCRDGGRPNAGVIMDAGGALYGTTSELGPSHGGGTVFRFQP